MSGVRVDRGRLAAAFALAGLLLLASACSGGDGEETPTQTGTVTPSATAALTASPTPEPVARECEPGSAVSHVVSASVLVIADGYGTAFHIGDGVFITAAHVVEGVTEVDLESDWVATPATVEAVDVAADVALLHAEPQAVGDLAALNWATEAPTLGTRVIAAGYPVDVIGTAAVTSGIISRLYADGGIDLIQVDASINPGNSGGPLFDECGDVLGVVVAKWGDIEVEGVGFAVSEASVRTALDTTAVPPQVNSTPSSGRPTPVGGTTLDVFALNIGECFDDPPNFGAGIEVLELNGIPCDQPHDNEVYALIDYPGDETAPFPGDDALSAFVEDECLVAFEEYVGGDYFSSNLDFADLRPTAGSWEQGDREVVCFLYDFDLRPLTGSAVGSGGQFEPSADAEPFGDWDAFNTFVGECFNDAGPVVDCEEPHDNEVYAIFSHEGGASAPYPGDDAMDVFAEDGCIAEFEVYVGIDYDSSVYSASYLLPSAETWAEGDREVVCYLYDEEFLIEGSMQGAAE